MEFNGFLVLAVLWFLVNLITSSRRKPPPPRPPKRQVPAQPPRTIRVGVDPTQREGTRLELVLRDLQRTLEDAAQSGYSTSSPIPPEEEEEEEFEEDRSLEVEPEVISLEDDVRREARRRFDQDDEAADIEARRIQAAAARDATHTRADHAAFDQRIRQEPVEHTASRGYSAKQLRDAVVWREILGPPVSER